MRCPRPHCKGTMIPTRDMIPGFGMVTVSTCHQCGRGDEDSARMERIAAREMVRMKSGKNAEPYRRIQKRRQSA